MAAEHCEPRTVLGHGSRRKLMTLNESIERFRAAANGMARGNPELVKAMYSQS